MSAPLLSATAGRRADGGRCLAGHAVWPPGARRCHRASLHIVASDLAELVGASGLDPETLCVSGIVSVPAAVVRALTKMRRPGRGFLIPYPELDQDLRPVPWQDPFALSDPPAYWRIRLACPLRLRPDEDRTAKYLGPREHPPRLYVPPLAPFSTGYLRGTGELWVTEGERKALAATQAGLPTLGIAGVWAWRRGGVADDRTALLEDLQRIPWCRVVTLVYDADITPVHPAWPAFVRLGAVLGAKGAAARILTLAELGSRSAA